MSNERPVGQQDVTELEKLARAYPVNGYLQTTWEKFCLSVIRLCESWRQTISERALAEEELSDLKAPRAKCTGCNETVRLEEDVHDGGSVMCLPEGTWFFDDEGTGDRPFCSTECRDRFKAPKAVLTLGAPPCWTLDATGTPHDDLERLGRALVRAGNEILYEIGVSKHPLLFMQQHETGFSKSVDRAMAEERAASRKGAS